MTNKPYPQRKSPRLQGFDYSRPGAYFVTVCTEDRRHFLGTVVDGVMQPTPAGRMLEDVWFKIVEKYPSVRLDAFIVMPNHIHILIWLTALQRPPDPDPLDRQSDDIENAEIDDASIKKIPEPTLSDIMRWYKSYTTALYRHGVVEQNWPPFPGRLWQRSFYDHIVRRDETLNIIRRYIQQNPKRWSLDRYHPEPERTDPIAAEIWRLLQDEENNRGDGSL